VPPFDLGRADWALTSKRQYYYVMLALGAVTYGVRAPAALTLRPRAGGRAQNESLAESVGVSAYRTTLVAMVVACALAGVGGSFYGHYTQFLSPELFAFYNTVTMVVMVVAGGQASVAGPAVGAIVFTFLPEFLRMAAFYRMLIYGVILLLAIMFMPRGIVDALQRLRRHVPPPLPAPSAGGEALVVRRRSPRARRHAARRGARHRAVRRAHRAVGRHLLARAPRDPGAHRAQRRRQDDGVPRHHRLPAADRRPCPEATRAST
jgi:hypothetical protein